MCVVGLRVRVGGRPGNISAPAHPATTEGGGGRTSKHGHSSQGPLRWGRASLHTQDPYTAVGVLGRHVAPAASPKTSPPTDSQSKCSWFLPLWNGAASFLKVFLLFVIRVQGGGEGLARLLYA